MPYGVLWCKLRAYCDSTVAPQYGTITVLVSAWRAGITPAPQRDLPNLPRLISVRFISSQLDHVRNRTGLGISGGGESESELRGWLWGFQV
jgi:hypothetical protein